MELIFIRHAHAGERTPGGRDRYRQLSERGREQAQLLVAVLNDYDIVEVLASPATRCVQTVEPLAESKGLTVTEDEALWEASSPDETVDCLVRSLDAGSHQQAAVLCSHGNIIPAVVESAAALGAAISGRGCERGSIWIVNYDGDRPVSAHYRSPRTGYQLNGIQPG